MNLRVSKIGNNDKTYLTSLINYTTHKLGIKAICRLNICRIFFLEEEIYEEYSKDSSNGYYDEPKTNEAQILIRDNRDIESKSITLIHELVHLKQYQFTELNKEIEAFYDKNENREEWAYSYDYEEIHAYLESYIIYYKFCKKTNNQNWIDNFLRFELSEIILLIRRRINSIKLYFKIKKNEEFKPVLSKSLLMFKEYLKKYEELNK